MRHVRSLLLACTAIAIPGMAGAADMPWGRGPAVISEGTPAEVEIGTGWYLRGDIGYVRPASPSLTMGGTTFNDIGRDGSLVVGGGFGYKFNDWLRADLTVDQISSYGMKRRIGSIGCFGVDTCTVDQKFDGKVVPVLANAYLDLGKWWGFTPYVGGGAGVARLRTGGVFAYTDTTTNISLDTAVSTRTKWSPAFAAMAGLAVDLGAGIQLDAGYRYLWLSEGSTGVRTQTGSSGVVPSSVEMKNAGFHQARIGLRYFLD